jgi:CO/xanthine dehydrogenase Mo-binding subunit
MHASLGPSAAMAQMTDGQLTIWSHSQGIFLLKAAVAQVLGMDEEAVRIIHAEGPGCYGHNGADDAALDAALLARALPGRPVMVKWTRKDEHTWEPYGPAMLMKMQASLDKEGKVIDWNHDVWGYPHFGRPRPTSDGTSAFIAAWHLAGARPRPEPGPSGGRHSGIHRNADPIYAFSRRRVVRHFAPNSPLRTSSLRGLGAFGNIFAIESFIDELAHAAGADPVAFRLRHLTDERAREVIEAVAEKSGWQPGTSSGQDGRGRGIAFAQYKNLQAYVAVVVEVSVDRSSGLIRLERAVIAAEAGQIVNPDGLSNQLEGGFVQSASYALKEQVRFDQFGIISVDWTSYPILPFTEAPSIETVLLNHPGRPFKGSGEAIQGPVPAAIANAVYDAVGVRLRHVPFTPDRVRAAEDDRQSP